MRGTGRITDGEYDLIPLELPSVSMLENVKRRTALSRVNLSLAFLAGLHFSNLNPSRLVAAVGPLRPVSKWVLNA